MEFEERDVHRVRFSDQRTVNTSARYNVLNKAIAHQIKDCQTKAQMKMVEDKYNVS